MVSFGKSNQSSDGQTGKGHWKDDGFCMCARSMSRVATLDFTTAVLSMARLIQES